VINHLLEGETWAREKLREHSAKTVLIHAGPLDVCLSVTAVGLVQPAAASTAPQLEVKLAPGPLLSVLRGEKNALKSAEVHGDAEFAADVMFLANNLRWDVEEDLSRIVGDIAAHRMVADTQRILAWERDARGRLAASVGEYLTDEAAVLAVSSAVQSFNGDVDRLRDDVARLEKRLQRLASDGPGNMPAKA
jgi:ubiquinone biosynthesis protein UbiJ